ncbi:hypothetical protein DFH08DRAFT_977619 [Mycena albidolilacea]|uniref:Uncharacterized protein n=1 Tax=Mycena albidolilacea TaxID=1033008 RepID=A0AAD7E932_9AGAR|nr:hypothetical protein DFH08DRAFT_977619 [Mycena albidolilacea]
MSQNTLPQPTLTDVSHKHVLGKEHVSVRVGEAKGLWFQPRFIKESKVFYKVNEDISWVDDPDNKINGLLSGFPVAILIAKDLVMPVTHSRNSLEETKKTDAASAASSGGFLNYRAYSNGYIIKIPGPQVFSTDADETQLMPVALPASFFIPDDEYNNTVNGTQPSEGVNSSPADGVHAPAGGSTPVAPTITQDKMQEVLTKMLNEKVAELFKTMTPAAGAGAGGSTS